MININYNQNSNQLIDMSNLDFSIYHARFLHMIRRNNDVMDKRKIKLTIKSKSYSVGTLKKYIEELKEEKAITIHSKILAITDIGKELLEKNKHFLKWKFKEGHKAGLPRGSKILNRKKETRKRILTSDAYKKLLTPKDIEILKILMAKASFSKLTMTDFSIELNMKRTLLIYRIRRLQKEGVLTYEHKQLNTLKILKGLDEIEIYDKNDKKVKKASEV